MLVLDRKLGEEIVIGEGDQRITLRVVRAERDRVRLDVTAPKDVDIWRGEIFAVLEPGFKRRKK